MMLSFIWGAKESCYTSRERVPHSDYSNSRVEAWRVGGLEVAREGPGGRLL